MGHTHIVHQTAPAGVTTEFHWEVNRNSETLRTATGKTNPFDFPSSTEAIVGFLKDLGSSNSNWNRMLKEYNEMLEQLGIVLVKVEALMYRSGLIKTSNAINDN